MATKRKWEVEYLYPHWGHKVVLAESRAEAIKIVKKEMGPALIKRLHITKWAGSPYG